MESPLLDHVYAEDGGTGATDATGAAATGADTNQRAGPNRVIVPFVACGDLQGFDSDQSYPLQLRGTKMEQEAARTVGLQAGASGAGSAAATSEYVYHAPVRTPIKPPYEVYMKLRHKHGVHAPIESHTVTPDAAGDAAKA